MTACVNRKHTKKVAAVVTASLVGALSLGAAPVAAMAEDTGIDMQALSAEDAFKQGKMTEARDGKNRKLDIPADGIITVEAGNYVKPTEITPKDGDPVDIDSTWVMSISGPSADYKTPGTYKVTVSKTIDSVRYEFTTSFIVEDEADLTNATLFDGNGGVSDTTFTYNGEAQDIQVAVNGKKLTLGDDYKMDLYKVVDTSIDPTGFKKVAQVVDAGTYVANIFDKDVTDTTNPANLEKQITFTVGKLDLASANISIADILETAVKGPSDTVAAVAVDNGSLTVGTDVKVIATLPSNSTGKASAIVSAVSGQGNVTGTKTVEFNVVKNLVTLVNYNDAPATSVNVNLSDGDSFKPNRIEVKDPTSTTGANLDSSYYTVSYRDADGNTVEASALSNPGKYTVVIRVNAEASHFLYGSGELTFDVNVQNATVTANDVVFKYDGKVGTSFSDTYTGEDFLPQIETTVHTKWGDDLVAGTDYTVQAYKGDEKVDQIVDEGTYTVKIEIKGNTGHTSDQCTFTVNPMDLKHTGLFVNGGDLTAYTWDDGSYNPSGAWVSSYKTIWYLGYTGDVIEPSFELGYYTDTDGKPASDSDVYGAEGDFTWHALPSDAYTVTAIEYRKDSTVSNWKEVDEVKDKGEYRVQFALETTNYDLGTNDEYIVNEFTVSSDSIAFADVDPNEWYADVIFDAKQLGYIKGIQDTNLYAPNSSITRADALVIISRMAGADTTYGEDWLNQNIGYVTRYSDVDANAYYARAVAWATKVGIVHGYGDGTFAPNKYITREEFAVMLANYAKAMGKFEAADGTALDSMSDANGVSDWAEESVAWAVENKVMGNKGFVAAQTDISRAEVAAMAVNYQPDGISSSVIG